MVLVTLFLPFFKGAGVDYLNEIKTVIKNGKRIVT